MTKRQFQRLQCRLRRSVNGLYHSYLASVLRGMDAPEAGHALAALPCRGARDGDTGVRLRRVMTGPRELKSRGDLGCARVRERLWQLQHVRFDLSAAGDRA